LVGKVLRPWLEGIGLGKERLDYWAEFSLLKGEELKAGNWPGYLDWPGRLKNKFYSFSQELPGLGIFRKLALHWENLGNFDSGGRIGGGRLN